MFSSSVPAVSVGGKRSAAGPEVGAVVVAAATAFVVVVDDDASAIVVVAVDDVGDHLFSTVAAPGVVVDSLSSNVSFSTECSVCC